MATLCCISACKKEELPRVPNTGSQTRPVFVSELRADKWTRDANGFYVHTFENVIYQGASVKVFLVSPGRDEQIKQYITYMDGQLWVTTRDADLALYYRCSGSIPFSSLTIRLEVE